MNIRFIGHASFIIEDKVKCASLVEIPVEILDTEG